MATPMNMLTNQEQERLINTLQVGINPLTGKPLSKKQRLQGLRIWKIDNDARAEFASEAATRFPERLHRAMLSLDRGIGRGMASVLGAPASLINLGLNQVGMGVDTPVGGVTHLRETLAPERYREYQAGPDRSVKLPLGANPIERIAGRTGEEVGAGLPVVGGLGAAARAGYGATSALGKAFVGPLRQHPGQVATAEVASAAGAGSAVGVAEEAGVGPTGQTLAALGGALYPTAALGIYKRVSGAGRRAATIVGDAFGDPNNPVRRRRAARIAHKKVRDIVKQNVFDSYKVRNSLSRRQAERGNQEVPDGPDFVGDDGRIIPPAVISGDEGLKALSKRMSTHQPIAQSLSSAADNIQNLIHENLVFKGFGNPEATRRYVERQLSESKLSLERSLVDVQTQIRAEAGDMPPEQMSTLIRASIIAHKDQASELVKKSFDVVDPQGKHRIFTGRVKTSVKKLFNTKTMAEQYSNNENRLYKLILDLENTTPFNELTSLRREIKDVIRRSTSSREKFRLGQVLEAVDKNIEDLATGNYPTALKARFKFAQGLHAQVSQIYRSGKILQMRRAGVVGDIVGGETPASTTLSQMIHRGHGTPEDALHLKRALSSTIMEDGKVRIGPMSKQNSDLIANYFVRIAYDAISDVNGRIVPERFAKWKQSFEPAIKQFPEAGRRLRHLGSLVKEVDELGLQSARVKTIVEDRALTTMLAESPQDAIAKVFRSDLKSTQAATLYKQVKDDPDAAAGLKQAFVDYIQTRFRTDKDDAGNVIFNSTSLQSFMKDPANIRTMMALGFDSKHIGQIRRFTQLVSDFSDTRKLINFQGVGVDSGQPTAGGLTVTSLLSRAYAVARGVVSPRFIGSEIGARVITSQFNRITREETMALLGRALVEPEIMNDLLTEITVQEAPKVVKRLRAHLWSLGYRAGNEDEAE